MSYTQTKKQPKVKPKVTWTELYLSGGATGEILASLGREITHPDAHKC